MFALALFLVGSIGASLAWNADSLIAWRVVQGAAGGLLLSVLTTLIMQAAGGKSLGRTVTLIALPALIGPILGPLVGGAILTHLSWRFMFWVNVPFCLAGLILAAKYLPKDTVSAVKPRMDVLGFALLAPGIAALILGLSNAGAAAGFGDGDVIIPLAVGAVLLVAFCLSAVRTSEPIVNIRLFAHRSVGSSSPLPGSPSSPLPPSRSASPTRRPAAGCWRCGCWRAASGSVPSPSRSWRSPTSDSTAPRSPTRAC